MSADINIQEKISFFFKEIDNHLSLVEVKGESVHHLFTGRLLIKELSELLNSENFKHKKEE